MNNTSSNDRVSESFALGFKAGAETGAASPREAWAALEAAGLEATVTNTNCFLNGNDDGCNGDTWRLDLGRRSTQELLEGLGWDSEQA